MKNSLEFAVRSQHSKPLLIVRSSLAGPVKTMKCLLVLALFGALLFVSARGVEAAATITVTSTSDSGAGSLRQAILDAVSGDTIDFSLPTPSTLALTSAELLINKSLTITGPGGGQLTVERSTAGGIPDFRIFHFSGVSDITISGLSVGNGSTGAADGGAMLNDSGGTVVITDCVFGENATGNGAGGCLYNTGTMTIANSTLSGNRVTGGGNGGVIDNEGNLDLTNCSLDSNSTTSGNGGAVYNAGSMSLTGCDVSLNLATSGGNGAGIYNSGDITITDSVLAQNVGGNGGALYADGTSTITNTTFIGNSTVGGGNGGAIYGIDLTDLTNCTLSNNWTTDGGNGGGIYALGTVNVANSTLNGNSAAGGDGGGNYSDDGTVSVINCTVSANFTAGGGDGGGIASPFVPISIKNTIVALNTADGTGPDVVGDFTSQGFNLIGQSDGSTGFTNGVNGDQAGTTASPLDPLLGPLQDNGGPTFTQALLFGSPAIDQGAAATGPATDPSTGDPIITDQRGMTRPVDFPNIVNATGGNGSDIGAFEVQMPSHLLNISTRANVQTGDNVLIGGFIVTGSVMKTVAIRAIGPSLANFNPPVAGPLADPVLELHEPDGTVVTNNDWMTNNVTDQAIIVANGLDMYNGVPISDLESIIIATLSPRDPSVAGSGEYTAVMSGNGGTTGVGLVEVYDLDQPAASELANISTRGLVGTVDNVLIGGIIVGGGGGGGATVLVRAIGPSLTGQGVSGVLADPTLELHDVNGTLIASNDNWKDNQEAAITATGIPPTNDLEPAIEDFLLPGNYTAIVQGQGGGTGVALVEAYNLN